MCKSTSRSGIHQANGQWIRTDKRLAVNLRDGFICLVCCKNLMDADPMDVTLDHVICRQDGGSNLEHNIYTCCRSCNCSRQSKPLNRFASKEAVQHIRRNLKRSLKPYMKLSRAFFAGEVGREELIEGKVL